MAYAYIGMGSNIGARRNIKKCINLLKAEFSIIKISNFYETKPYGYENQQNFINLAVKMKTTIKTIKLLKKLQSIEKGLGRKRKVKNGPRTIDLDILLYDNKVIKEKGLQIPHKGLFERDFTLIPLLDIAPEIIDPITKKKAKYLKKDIKYRQIIRKIIL
ncbi:MAG: 2-amino-4-hydroxy-6-hydroxymethyldihydropteridine diphosphokinase [Nanoarchaeota archaeon]